MAPVHIYFHPSTTTTTTTDQHQTQFRGRKLLAKPPVAVQGLVIGYCESKLKFDHIQEWHHEETLVAASNSRVETAMQWCNLANAVHEEIPVLEE